MAIWVAAPDAAWAMFLLGLLAFSAAATTTIIGFANGSVSLTGHPIPHPERPYHLLGLLGDGARHRFLRPIAEIALAFAISLSLLLVAAVIFGRLLEGTEPGPIGLLGAAIPYAVLLPAVLIAVGLTGRRPGTVSSVAGSVRWRWLGGCAVRGLAVTVVEVLVQLLLRGNGWRPENWPGAAAWWLAAGAVVVAFPFSTAGLIYLNGLILQVFGTWTARRWPAIVLAAAATTAWSWPDTPLEIATSTVFGLSMWWITIRTGGLEAVLGLNVVRLIVFEGVEQSQGIDDRAPTPDVSLLEMLPSALAYILAVLAYTWWTARTASTGSADLSTEKWRIGFSVDGQSPAGQVPSA